LFGIPLSQNVDVNGRPLSGAQLFIYQAGTLTPAQSFQDSALTILQTFPLVADAAGRIPVFWVNDGTYRARLTDANLNQIYDNDGILAIGPSGGGGGGGGGGTVNGFTTGDMIFIPIGGTRTGFVRANARTIGSASSGANERANADCSNLYGYLWNNFTQGTCPVTGGRGASATADFGNNKPIQNLDFRGKGPFGLDDMGNTAAGIITGGTTPSSTGGIQALTILQTHLPNVNLSSGGLAVGSHNHGVGTFAVGAHNHDSGNYSGTSGTMNSNQSHTHSTNRGGGDFTASSGGNTVSNSTSATTGSANIDHTHNFTVTSGNSGNTTPSFTGSSASTTPSISGNVPLGGSGTVLPSLPPYSLGTWLISL
jgi:hypothetical protein